MLRMPREQKKSNRILHISIICIIIVFICIVAGALIFKYQIEGETNAIFDISKILIISTAEAVQKENPSAKWDCNINQNNDLYITIEKNNKRKDAIKYITINNIRINKEPGRGKIRIFRPAEEGLFECSNEYKIENELIYSGSKNANLKNLEVSNQGGTVIIRLCNENVGEYISNEEEQINQDGTLLKNISLEEISTNIDFDVIIETENGLKFKTTVNIDLPVENIDKEGICTQEINKNEIVLKRI